VGPAWNFSLFSKEKKFLKFSLKTGDKRAHDVFRKKLENLCCNSKDFEGCGYPRKMVLVSF